MAFHANRGVKRSRRATSTDGAEVTHTEQAPSGWIGPYSAFCVSVAARVVARQWSFIHKEVPMPSTTSPSPTRLLPQQTRLIHASEGMRLRVVAGRIWLTQPNMAQDLFLGPGDVVDLMQDWVVVGADAAAGSAAASAYSAYELQPLVARQPRRSGFRAVSSVFQRLRALAAGASRAAVAGASAP